MKVKVVTLKDIVKYLVKISVVFSIIAILTNFFYGRKNNNYMAFDASKFISTLKKEILLLRGNEDTNINLNQGGYITGTMDNEFSMFKAIATTNPDIKVFENDNDSSQNTQESSAIESNQDNNNGKNEESNGLQTTDLQEAQTGVNVEVVPSNVADKTSCEIYGVKLRNESKYNLEEEITDLNVDINKQDIIIFHTHTCESYTATEQYNYESTGNYRTTDLNYSVARVGDELDKYLSNYGYNVVHDKSYHDYPAYNGSYDRSLITVQNLLETYQDTDVVIDLHRDAIGDNTYAPKVKIGDEYCARLMFVIGTDGGGLKNDNWRENLKFAIKVVQKGNELYPGLFKPIIVRNSRYNHHVSSGACIIEVGATGNTLEECLNSMKYLAKVYDEM